MTRLCISIITPSFNHARFIRRTIDSILSQSGNFDLDYRVLDGGSQDDTVAILKSYGDRFTWSSAPDNGQVDAINRGLRAATGDIVGWVNSDDVLLPGALEKIANAFRENPEAEWVHGRCEIIDLDDQPIRKWISAYKSYRARRHSFENLLTENYVSQMTTFWRRSVHEEVGYLDESLKFAFDYEFWLRLAERGAPIFLDEKIACFRWYETSKSGANFERQFNEDERISMRYLPTQSKSVALRKRIKSAAIPRMYALMSRIRGATFGRSTSAR